MATDRPGGQASVCGSSRNAFMSLIVRSTPYILKDRCGGIGTDGLDSSRHFGKRFILEHFYTLSGLCGVRWKGQKKNLGRVTAEIGAGVY